jgi:hypothetical protein
MTTTKNKNGLYGGLVWILSASFLTIYGTLGALDTPVPGVEELVKFLSTINGAYISLGAFLAIFFEGLYFFGSFFPGTTLVILLALFSQVGGSVTFFITVILIFLGWTLSSAVNITLARTYQARINHQKIDTDLKIKDHLLTTWFPAFRANHEVAQVAEGGNPWQVFKSSVRVKFIASLAAGFGAFLIPYFIDIKTVSNEEGFLSLSVVALISLTIGIIKIRRYLKNEK